MLSSWNQLDLVVLSRDAGSLSPEVERGIRSQLGVQVDVYRVVGAPRPDDQNRLDTIVRARNQAKQLGRQPWLMFLDDDVVLGDDCIATLLAALRQRRFTAGVAADYLREAGHGEFSSHVGMGATLFRRSALNWINFRWQPGRCECQCCCDDLRRQLQTIGYVPQARAWHRKGVTNAHPTSAPPAAANSPTANRPVGHVLSAFNRAHFRRFRDCFITSLRASGNHEPVTAVAYGLRSTEARWLAGLPNVNVLDLPDNGVSPSIRRLFDFQQVVARLPEHAYVAYWDAADVRFQSCLHPLWELARQNPGKLLVVAEAKPPGEHPLAHKWTYTIKDPVAREHAQRVMRANPYLNGGFAAATPPVMLEYLRAAHQLRNSPAIEGTLDWGDQTAMNVYCHTDPSRREIISDDWNFLLAWRRPGEVRLGADQVFVRASGAVIPVVHGVGKKLEPFWTYQKLLDPGPLAVRR